MMKDCKHPKDCRNYLWPNHPDHWRCGLCGEEGKDE